MLLVLMELVVDPEMRVVVVGGEVGGDVDWSCAY
jgi:hypothetical protein